MDRMRLRVVLAVLLAIAAFGCKKSDPKVTLAWERACHANESVMQNGTPESYNAKMITWINDHSHDETVKAAFAKANTLSTPDDKASYIRDQASNNGVMDCPVIAAMWPTAKK